MKLIVKTCRICRKRFEVPRYYVQRGQYKCCSVPCANKLLAITRQGSGNPAHDRTVRRRHCLACHKSFRPRPAQVRRGGKFGKFCSQQCYGAHIRAHRTGSRCYQYQKRLRRICTVCHAPFKILRSHTAQKTCSRKCQAFAASSKNRYFNSSIERKTRQMLKTLALPFEFQRHIPKIGRVDFFVPPRLIVQCDGKYWHSRPAAVQRDNAQNQAASRFGFKMLRLAEDEINKQPETAVLRLQTAARSM